MAPAFAVDAFHCPRCNAYAHQHWYNMQGNSRGSFRAFEELCSSVCSRCGGNSFWVTRKLIEPKPRNTPAPNTDLQDSIKAVYIEAADIRGDSLRGAAALLRLCIQMICIQLGEDGSNLNNDITSLVAKGLPVEIKQALDVVRVIGNNAVHPGQIDLNESPDTVTALFTLVNVIADRMISQPRQIAALHGTLPPTIQAAIAKRDEKAQKSLPAPKP